MTDLFQWAACYPRAPGFKERTTSRDAARAAESGAETLRAEAFAAIAAAGERGLTADECAADLGRGVLSVRPRVSELRNLGKIAPSGLRRRNESGAGAIAWRAAPWG